MTVIGGFGGARPRTLSACLALAAFVSLVIVPNLKYPANPPSVGDPDTIGCRTGLFFLMIAISIAVAVFSLNLRRAFAARMGQWNASIVAGLIYLAIVAAVQYALPTINAVPAAFPAVVLWKFRVAAIGMQAIPWTTLGLLFGALVERSGLVGAARGRLDVSSAPAASAAARRPAGMQPARPLRRPFAFILARPS